MSRASKKDYLSFLNDLSLPHEGETMASFWYQATAIGLLKVAEVCRRGRGSYSLVQPLFAQIISWKRKILKSIFYLGIRRYQALLTFSNTRDKCQPLIFRNAARQMQRLSGWKSVAVPAPGEAVRGVEKKRQVSDGLKHKGRKRNKIVREQNTSILVAADNRAMNDRIRHLLPSDYQVICACDGRQAYDAIVREQPQVAIVDALLPLMNGYDLLSLIKGNQNLEDTAVILLASRIPDEPEEDDVLEEADEFLMKPFTRTELLARVRTQVKLSKYRKIIKEQEVQLTRQSIEQKDRFIGIAGHELKTPLTSLQAYTELLAEKASTLDKETLQKYLNKSTTFVKRLNKLVIELLDVSRMKSGKMEYRFSDFNFKEMVEENVEIIKSFASGHRFQVEGDLPVVLRGDRERLSQVLQNLLSNAVRYSPNGGTISVYCRRAKDEVIVSVRDEGLGIPDAEKRKIFESYNRTSTRHQTSGLGLGLFICATIIERHGGKIWLESKVGKGSVFYFSLPRKF